MVNQYYGPLQIPSGCDEADNSGPDNSDYTDLPKDWVGIVHYGRCYSGTSEDSSEKWPSVIDRVRREVD